MDLVPGLGRSLEKEMATHSSILAWEIPWTKDSGGLQSIGFQRVGHDLVTKQRQQQQTSFYPTKGTLGLPKWLSGQESTCQCRRCGFNLWVEKVTWRRAWQPTPVFLPGKSHGQRNLADYSPWGHKNQTWLSDQTIATTPTSSLSFMLPRNLQVAWVKVEDRGPEWLAEEVFFSKICLV